jgi:hypothetical protein
MHEDHCNVCGAPVKWIKTRGGKNMPCDPKPVNYWKREGAAGKVITAAGDVVSCLFEGYLSNVTGQGFISHFATCKGAARVKAAQKSQKQKDQVKMNWSDLRR